MKLAFVILTAAVTVSSTYAFAASGAHVSSPGVGATGHPSSPSRTPGVTTGMARSSIGTGANGVHTGGGGGGCMPPLPTPTTRNTLPPPC
jgi:hypothetical protein